MPRSPIPVRDVLEYLKLEDAEGLVHGSVKYVGAIKTQTNTKHYWSYPLNGRLAWAVLDGDSLGDAHRIPSEIRAKTAPLKAHRTERPLPFPKVPWVGEKRPVGSLPKWVPASRVHLWDLGYVATFLYDFNRAADIFGAKPSMSKDLGGAGPSRYFFLDLGRNRLARLESVARHYGRINLYLPEREGVAYWDDYDKVMGPLGVPLEEAFRQGGVNFRHRKPTPEARERTRDHHQRMWIPR